MLLLGEWDIMSVTIANAGWGSARNIQVAVEGPVTTEIVDPISELAVGSSKTVEVALRPDNAGRAVPVSVKVSYQDSVGNQTGPPVSKRLQVLRPNESRSGTEVKDGMA
jgi:hypothetical protein